MELLRRAGAELAEQGWRPVNIDCTLVAERPRLAAYIPQMRENIARVLQLEPEQVNIKAKTAEGMDSAGRGEGIIAQAVALLQK